MADSVTVTLKTPINTHAGETTSIVLKEPKAKSFFEHGEPFKMRLITKDDVSRVEFDYNHKIVGLFLQDMSGIDTVLLGTVAANDYMSLCNAATNLIMGIAGSTPTPA
jgi:hypothetical protein